MISIVTPSFRQLELLGLAMASAADQQGAATEHIIHDAGTGGIEAWFEEKRARFASSSYTPRLYVERDEGMYDAINRGLVKATGDICAYLNCDEQYLPGALARVGQIFAEAPDLDMLFGDVVLVDRGGAPVSYRRMVLPRLRHVELVHLNTLSCAMFFRRRLVERGFLFEPEWKAIGDMVWVARLLRAGVRMKTIPEPLAVFTFTGENLGASPVSTSERQRFRSGLNYNAASTPAAVVMHRLRKIAAGAYRSRRVEVSIYTLDSPERRKTQVRENVGFGWPTDS